MTVNTISIRGKRYTISNVPAPSGECDHPMTAKKLIAIPKDGDTMGELVVIIHEMLHAAFWDLDEEVVDQVGYDIGRALWRLGWRLDEDQVA